MSSTAERKPSAAEKIKRAAVLKKLRTNAGRRGEAVVELESSRAELQKLLKAGRDHHVPVTKMCEAAGINRERAYELLRRDTPPVSRDVYRRETE